MQHVLALDQGTTSSRAIVFDAGARILGVVQEEFDQHFPAPGRVEHDPADIWETQYQVAVHALRNTGLGISDVAAIGITNQRETTLIWNRRTGRPIYRAIVWQDRRTAPVCAELREAGHEAKVTERTGLLLDPYFSATKIAWILDHVRGARQQAEAGELAFGTVDTWLLWRLTEGAVHATDASNASRTLLYDIRRNAWDDEMLALFRVPRELLPEIRGSSEVYGEARVEGLRGLPIAGIAGDQQAALFGEACFRPGQAKNTFGTGCFALLNTGTKPSPSKHRLLTTVAWRIGNRTEYALEGSVFTGGAVVQWLRDGLGLVASAADVESLARQVPDTGDVVVVPAFTGLGAPHWDPLARGLIIGLTRGTKAAHIARASLESIALQVADVLDAMVADASTALDELRVDGGAANNDLLVQMQADLLQIPVVRPTLTETTALGAAFLAGLATGVWPHQEAIAAHWQADRIFEPRLAASEAAKKRARWNEAVRRSRSWA
jgi:glycerol kinase